MFRGINGTFSIIRVCESGLSIIRGRDRAFANFQCYVFLTPGFQSVRSSARELSMIHWCRSGLSIFFFLVIARFQRFS